MNFVFVHVQTIAINVCRRGRVIDGQCLRQAPMKVATAREE